jgi:prepilin-type N-terminal cleavage/methylation domain-containing protein
MMGTGFPAQARNAGFTLIELLVGIAVMGLIIGALYELADRIIATYHATAEKQELMPRARYALERMVMFVQESDEIKTPATEASGEILTVSERLSDQYNNATHAYTAAGDGLLDADTDANGLINDPLLHPQDIADYVTFDLDKTDAANWKLMEQMPNYGTVQTDDFLAKKLLCEGVQAFSCRRLAAGLVEISLTIKQGKAAVTVQTTARARWVE